MSDVGQPKHPGSAAFDPSSSTYQLSAAGVNMWDVRDEFLFVWTQLEGDFLIHARVEFLGPHREPHRKAGCIIRPSFDAAAPYADGALHGDGLTSLQFRRVTGAVTEQLVSPARGSDVVELERRGGRIMMRAARQGDALVETVLEDLDLDARVYCGLFLCSHNVDIIERAAFHDVRLERR